MFAQRPAKVRKYFEELWAGKQLPTDQDRLLDQPAEPGAAAGVHSLLHPVRSEGRQDRRPLSAGLWDQGAARAHQQAQARRRARGRCDLAHDRFGQVLHDGLSVQGAVLHESLKDCRIVVVTDRVDLEKQLSKTFLTGGAFGQRIASQKEGEKAKVDFRARPGQAHRSGQRADHLHDHRQVPHRLEAARCHNPSENMIVLVDEGHRSHGGEGHERMRKALPNAAYIAFTGTPLLKDDKTTNKFGPIVHAYTMQRAVEDGTVTPLLYEERKPELEVNEKAIDNWFDKITAGLSDEQKSDLKKKWGKKGPVYGSANRIELIAWDIAVHFDENIKKLGQGLKGQIATDSKRAAIRYKKSLDETGLVTSAVVISPPDTREGHTDVDEGELPEVQQWWKDNVKGDAEDYEREVIEDFSTDGPPDLLIVVDKLLTGFDEPRNAVLYIDKPLKQHNLIQAIARVNRLHDAKKYGLLIDYRGILKELDTAIDAYQDLASRTQGGFDIDDIEGLYQQVSTEYKRLPMLHERLLGAIQRRQEQAGSRAVPAAPGAAL